jgi:LysR family glycine cleavage system transcriptional activator
MNQPLPHPRQRPLALDGLRAFEAVARRLSFSAAAEELHLTQSAISRQIKSLEDELGASLFNRGTRKVELTAAGLSLQQSVEPALERIDRTVRHLRVASARRHVNLSTFASFATLWLMPRLMSFQRLHPDIDIRISATERLMDVDDPEFDLLLRYDFAAKVPEGAELLFDELISPVASPLLQPMPTVATDLAQQTLLDEDNHSPSSASLRWRRWLQRHGQPQLEPKRWLYLNYTHQQVQGALAGQGVALARLSLARHELAEGRLVQPFALAVPAERHYGLVVHRPSPAADAFAAWLHGHCRTLAAENSSSPG